MAHTLSMDVAQIAAIVSWGDFVAVATAFLNLLSLRHIQIGDPIAFGSYCSDLIFRLRDVAGALESIILAVQVDPLCADRLDLHRVSVGRCGRHIDLLIERPRPTLAMVRAA